MTKTPTKKHRYQNSISIRVKYLYICICQHLAKKVTTGYHNPITQ